MRKTVARRWGVSAKIGGDSKVLGTLTRRAAEMNGIGVGRSAAPSARLAWFLGPPVAPIVAGSRSAAAFAAAQQERSAPIETDAEGSGAAHLAQAGGFPPRGTAQAARPPNTKVWPARSATARTRLKRRRWSITLLCTRERPIGAR